MVVHYFAPSNRYKWALSFNKQRDWLRWTLYLVNKIGLIPNPLPYLKYLSITIFTTLWKLRTSWMITCSSLINKTEETISSYCYLLLLLLLYYLTVFPNRFHLCVLKRHSGCIRLWTTGGQGYMYWFHSTLSAVQWWLYCLVW